MATRDLFTHPILAGDGDSQFKNNGNNNYAFGIGNVEITKDVGTAMYIAPEIEKNSSVFTKFYSSKADVYR